MRPVSMDFLNDKGGGITISIEDDITEEQTPHLSDNNNTPTISIPRKFISMPWFCFMMVNWQPEQKINTWIEETINPTLSLKLHNKKIAPKSKYTKSAAGFWKLEMIVGEFKDFESASKFVHGWKQQSRGIRSRRERGIDLANKNKLVCWDKRVLEK